MAIRNCQGRKLHWKICVSEQVADLSSPWAKLLFTWLVPTVDNLGRMEAEPYQVKGVIFPYEEEMTPERIGELLQELHDAGLIIWYRARRLRYLQLPTFGAHQKLVGNMRAESDYPGPGEEDIRAWETKMKAVYTTYARRTNGVSTEEEEEEEDKGEEEGLHQHPLVELARTKIPGWKPDPKDEQVIAASVERLGADTVRTVILQLASYQAANNKYRMPRKALANWLNRESNKDSPARSSPNTFAFGQSPADIPEDLRAAYREQGYEC